MNSDPSIQPKVDPKPLESKEGSVEQPEEMPARWPNVRVMSVEDVVLELRKDHDCPVSNLDDVISNFPLGWTIDHLNYSDEKGYDISAYCPRPPMILEGVEYPVKARAYLNGHITPEYHVPIRNLKIALYRMLLLAHRYETLTSRKLRSLNKEENEDAD